MTSRTNSGNKEQTRDQRETRMPHRLQHRRQPAIARYLAGDKIETICREMDCSKGWLYKGRVRYQAYHPTWAQALSRRPTTSPAKLDTHIDEESVHRQPALLPHGAA